ncbi:MAG: FG-GAP-like repeat-containing protein [Flavobacteriales bacterium]|nr:FG-GAP-like repeat-containing protein [Flavobacteriales bacterium]
MRTTVKFYRLFFLATSTLWMNAGAQFINMTDEFGIYNVATGTYDGSGCSFYDFNNDGWDDLTLGNGADDVLFYLNNNGSFIEVDLGIINIDHGQVKMVLWGDYDNDHDADLLITHDMFPTRLWRNNGNLNFVEVADISGIDPGYYHYFGAAWADVDKDSFLDLYIAEFYNPDQNPGFEYESKFYHNNGNGTFTENTIGVGLALGPRPCFQPVFLDYDKDGWSDLFLVIDRDAWNTELFRNNGNGTFTNVTYETNTGPDTGGPMSGTVDDYDNDGDLDIFVSSDQTGNVLLKNNDGLFENIAVEAGVSVYAICWGALWLDYDNDTWHDLFVGTTIGLWGPYENKWFINQHDDTFTPGNEDTGTTSDISPTITVTMGDCNNDGYFDYLTNNNDPYPSVFWLNEGGDNNYLSVTLQGTTSNYEAIGSWITCYAGGNEYVRFTVSGENCIGQNSRKEIFGLGSTAEVDSLVVLWPDGVEETWYNVELNQNLELIQGSTSIVPFDLITNGGPEICPEGSMSLYAGVYQNYLWSTGETTAFISVNQPGTYSVEVTDEFGIENTSNEIVVSVLPAPAPVVESQNVLCYGDATGSAEFMLSNGEVDTVVWSNDSTSTAVTNMAAGVYSFVGTTTDGCSFSGNAIITQPDSLWTEAVATDALCNGESSGTASVMTTGGTPEYAEDWMGYNPAQLAAGNYQVLVADLNLCSTLVEFEIQEPSALQFDLDTTGQYENGENGTASLSVEGGTPPYTVEWSNDVTDTSTITGLAAGFYSVIITDSLGCTAEADFVIDYLESVSELSNNNIITIHPNPAKDFIEVAWPTEKQFEQLSLLDEAGREIFSQKISSNPLVISLEGLSRGVYVLELSDAVGRVSSRQLAVGN